MLIIGDLDIVLFLEEDNIFALVADYFPDIYFRERNVFGDLISLSLIDIGELWEVLEVLE